MGEVKNSALVRRPITAVFATATTARYWPRWHPATRGVSGAVDHPVLLGQQIIEQARIAGMPGTAYWTCVEHDPPHRLALDATNPRGVTARSVYTFAERPGGTLVTRTLTYHLPGPLGALLDRLAVAQVMREQSATAITNLKALIEAEVPAG